MQRVPTLTVPPCAASATDLASRPRSAGSFAELYDAHFAFVWRSARRLGVQEDALDDVVQEVFIVAYRKLAGFEGRSSLRTWLFGILRRVTSDYRRKQARRRTEPLYEEPTAPASEGPLHAMEEARARALVHEALACLDLPFREVLILADLEQMTAPDIADALELKLNTVYSRLRTARRRFEAALRRLNARQPGGRHG